MKAVGLSADVIVVTSRIWQTTCTLVRSGEEAFCIDSPILPDELELLPKVAEQAEFNVVGALATHADWDHLLARYAFPEAPLGVERRSERRLRDGSAQRALRDFDDEHYLERPGPLKLPSPQVLPVPGKCEIGEQQLELRETKGHTADGLAVWIPWERILVIGDYLSPVEVPMISDGGSVEDYLITLDLIEPIVKEAEWVVPGHGPPMDAARAHATLREDREYVGRLPTSTLPYGRQSAAQKKIHRENQKRTGGGPPPG